MTDTIDLNILPVINHSKQQIAALPGLHAAERPRHPARGRQEDQLVFYLALQGNAPMTTEKLDQLLARLAQTFYKTPGSVTAALKRIAETLNLFLLDRNMRGSSSGHQAIGVLSQIVLHHGKLYLAQSGTAHMFLISRNGAQQLYDPVIAGRGLGLGKTVSIHFFQSDFSTNDNLIITLQPPTEWKLENLGSLYGQGPESLRRRITTPDLTAVLIQAKSGSGKISLLRPKPVTPSAEAAAITLSTDPAPNLSDTFDNVAIQDAIELPASFVQYQSEYQDIPPANFPFNPTSTAETRTPIQPDSSTALPPGEVPISSQSAGASIASKRKPSHQERPKKSSSAFASMLLTISQKINIFLDRLASSTSILLNRLLPGDATTGLSSSVMAFIAMAIPLVVVTLASVIYFQSGRASQFEVFFQQAQQSSLQAQAQADPINEHLAWENVLTYLDQAETYQSNTESQALRAQAGQAIDNLDGIKRLNFFPALTTKLPEELIVSQMAATKSELFLLDSLTGSVFRAVAVTNGYELDKIFLCGPGSTGVASIGKLIDFAIFPKGNQLNSIVKGLDSTGLLITCTAGEDPVVTQLQPPPTGFGTLRAFTSNLGNLYVLDPEKNAVWIYWKNQIDLEPELFFSEEIPPMKDVFDLAVNERDLYLLNTDGHLTRCAYSGSGVSPTRCTDPSPYVDSRSGKENREFKPDTPFTQILATQPPDPSLFLFEPASQAIHHFSLRLLTFHRQYRPASLPGYSRTLQTQSASAFTISNDNRVVFIAVGDQVLYANLP